MGDVVTHAHIVAPAEAEHVKKVVELSLDSIVSVDLAQCFDEGVSCSHVVSGVHDSPKVTNRVLERIGRHHPITGMISKLLVLLGHEVSLLCDSIAGGLVVWTVSGLVVLITVILDLAS